MTVEARLTLLHSRLFLLLLLKIAKKQASKQQEDYIFIPMCVAAATWQFLLETLPVPLSLARNLLEIC